MRAPDKDTRSRSPTDQTGAYTGAPILTTVGGNDTLPVAKGIGYVMGYDEAVRAQSTTAAIAFLKRHLLR
jgi:hypothetical protein